MDEVEALAARGIPWEQALQAVQRQSQGLGGVVRRMAPRVYGGAEGNVRMGVGIFPAVAAASEAIQQAPTFRKLLGAVGRMDSGGVATAVTTAASRGYQAAVAADYQEQQRNPYYRALRDAAENGLRGIGSAAGALFGDHSNEPNHADR
jgi:hypothetical protein